MLQKAAGSVDVVEGVPVTPTAPEPSTFSPQPSVLMTWTFDGAPFGRSDVIVYVPEITRDKQRFNVLVAYHGLGESKKGPKRGALAWVKDYHLLRQLQTLNKGRLTSRDFGGLVSPERLSEHNSRLQARGFVPPIIVMPYTPDVLRRADVYKNAPRLGEFLIQEVLARVNQSLPSNGKVSLDGVSLGGRAALFIGLSFAPAFVSLSATQAAIDEEELDELTRLAKQARRDNPALTIRLLTSEEDHFLEVNNQLSKRWLGAGVRHELAVVPGEHNYAFNRGPGGLEILLFQQRF